MNQVELSSLIPVAIPRLTIAALGCPWQDDCTTSSSSRSSRGAEPTVSTSTVAEPLLYTLYSSGTISGASFAVAMCDDDDADVSIGGLDSSLVSGDMSYAETQMTFGEYYGYYLIYTSGVTVGSTSVTVDNVNLYGGLVVDTGTTLHYLPTATVKAIETAVTSAVDDSSVTSTSFYNWESCVSSTEISSFPDVTYTFAESSASGADTFDVTLKPEHYLLKYGGCYYWGFEESSLGIFGNIGMKDKVVDFDVTNNKIGFGNGVCDSTTSSFVKTRTPSEMLGEVMAQVNSHSSSELFTGVLSAVAVVGTVLGSAFVVLNKLVTKSSTREKSADSSETAALLPPL